MDTEHNLIIFDSSSTRLEITSTSSNYDSSSTSFEFPIEVWRIILSYLDYNVIRFATVSKIWNDRIVFSSITDLSHFSTQNYSFRRLKAENLNNEFIQRFISLQKLDLTLKYSKSKFQLRMLD
jgi:hypothetical protein